MITEIISLCIATYCINGCASDGSEDNYIKIQISKNGTKEYKAIYYEKKGDVYSAFSLERITFYGEDTIKIQKYHSKRNKITYNLNKKSGEYIYSKDKKFVLKINDGDGKKVFQMINQNKKTDEILYFIKIIDKNNIEFENNHKKGTLWKLDIKI